jgi:hypothetical protein
MVRLGEHAVSGDAIRAGGGDRILVQQRGKCRESKTTGDLTKHLPSAGRAGDKSSTVV